jgi:hypothetical protein
MDTPCKAVILVVLFLGMSKQFGFNYSLIFIPNPKGTIPVVAIPIIPERTIRPFVFIGANTSGELERRQMLNTIILELAIIRRNVEVVICDTFDRELIHRIRKLGFSIEEYPMFSDEFSYQLFYLQKSLKPNMYQAYGLNDLQFRAMERVSHYRHIPFIAR